MVLEEDNETRNRLSLGCVIPTNSCAVPSQITERNRKDKLYNSFSGCQMYGNNLVSSCCVMFSGILMVITPL